MTGDPTPLPTNVPQPAQTGSPSVQDALPCPPTAAQDTQERKNSAVLLVEDNEAFAFLVRNALKRHGGGRFTLFHAGGLKDALDLAKRQNIEVVLLDLGLPDSHGLMTFLRLRAQLPDVPAIILTALDSDETALAAMRNGAHDYLQKSALNGELLVRTLRYAIERGRFENAIRDLSGRLLRLQDEERRRIARSLHDVTAQTLAALSINLSLLERMSSQWPAQTRATLHECLACAEACSREVRTASYLLHPPLLDEIGLAAAVREYADGFARRSGIRVDLEIGDGMERVPGETATAIFRVLQESLANVHRHARSPTASIRLAIAGGAIGLEVADAGCGIPPERLASPEGPVAGGGVGISSMRERLRPIGGVLAIESDNRGTRVRATVAMAEGTS